MGVMYTHLMNSLIFKTVSSVNHISKTYFKNEYFATQNSKKYVKATLLLSQQLAYVIKQNSAASYLNAIKKKT